MTETPKEVKWTPEAAEVYENLRQAAKQASATRKKTGKTKTSKQEGGYIQVKGTVKLMNENLRHPSLNTHEYDSMKNPFDEKGKPKGKVFEAYAQNQTPGAYRVFWVYGPGQKEITIIAITAHP